MEDGWEWNGHMSLRERPSRMHALAFLYNAACLHHRVDVNV